MPTPLEDFAQRWSLDAAAVEWIASLPPDVCSVLIEQFDPREDTHNVVGKMRGFARSIQARLPAQRPSASVGEAVAGIPRLWRRDSFIAHWHLDASAVSLLQSLSADVQATVMQEFDPKGDVVNVSGKLSAFARSVAAKRNTLDALDTFLAQWGLDHASKQFLQSLPEDVLATVLEQFDPARDTRDVAGKLRMFAKGILNGSGQSQRHPLEATPPFESAPSSSGRSIAAPFTRAAPTDLAVSQFVLRWGLDSTSVEFLESLADDVRATVIAEFEPRSNTRDVGAKLRAFASTVTSSQGRGTPRGLSDRQVPTAVPVSVSADDSQLLSEVEFLERWGLSDNQTASDVLRRLHPPVRARVMSEFAPGQDTRDVFGKLCGFASSVARASTKGGIFPVTTPQLLRGTPSTLVEARQPGVSKSRGKGRTLSALDHFADKYQLDEGSRALLRGLEPHVQATVMAEFQPHSDVRDLSGKFCSFARSVATRLAETRGPKRRAAQGPGAPSGPPPRRLRS